MKIVGGSVSLNLAKEVGRLLKIKVLSSNLIRFPDGEIKVQARILKIS